MMASTEIEQTCPGCGLSRSQWRGNGGEGYSKAENCTAAASVPRAPGARAARPGQHSRVGQAASSGYHQSA